MRYDSTNKLPFASLLKFESHYPLLRRIVQLTNSATFHFRNWSFNNKMEQSTIMNSLILKGAIAE
jgi:hypothetical protein